MLLLIDYNGNFTNLGKYECFFCARSTTYLSLAVDELGDDVVDVVVVFDGGVRDDDDNGIRPGHIRAIEDISEHGTDRARAVYSMRLHR